MTPFPFESELYEWCSVVGILIRIMFGHAGTVAFTIEIKPLLKYIIEIEVGNVFY